MLRIRQSYRAAQGIPTRRHEADEEHEKRETTNLQNSAVSCPSCLPVGIPLKIPNDFDGALEDSR
jgi:hypothetical protein